MKNYNNFRVFVFAFLLFSGFVYEIHSQISTPKLPAAETAKKLADEVPNRLPQSPVAAKLKSDVQDLGLRGKVRFVHTEIRNHMERNPVLQRKSVKYEEFNEAGNLVKEIEYDGSGTPNVINLYGYVSGKRVILSIALPNPNSFFIATEENSKSAKRDNRYSSSFKYKYLNGKLVEETLNSNNGLLSSRIKYIYKKNTKESYFYDEDNWLWRKTVETFDANGNTVKRIEYEPDEGKLIEQFPFIIKYESFDLQGNWTERSISRLLDLGEKEKLIPENVEYRTITYF